MIVAQLLFYVDDVNILVGSVNTVTCKKKRISSSYSKEIGLEIIAEKTKVMVMSRDQNAG